MLSPRFAAVMKKEYERVNGPIKKKVANMLEPKFGWGHAQFKKDLADKIESLQIDPSWRPHEILRYVAKIARDS
jgi:hypothetical protein